MIRIVNVLLALLFGLFAFFQINDSDAGSWVVLYGYVAIMSALAVFNRYYLVLLIPGIAIFGLYFIYLTPSILDWFMSDDGLVGVQMSDAKPYIERTREAFGLLMGLAVLVFHLVQSQRPH